MDNDIKEDLDNDIENDLDIFYIDCNVESIKINIDNLSVLIERYIKKYNNLKNDNIEYWVDYLLEELSKRLNSFEIFKYFVDKIPQYQINKWDIARFFEEHMNDTNDIIKYIIDYKLYDDIREILVSASNFLNYTIVKYIFDKYPNIFKGCLQDMINEVYHCICDDIFESHYSDNDYSVDIDNDPTAQILNLLIENGANLSDDQKEWINEMNCEGCTYSLARNCHFAQLVGIINDNL
jgi:hypothetical protein